MKEKESAMRRVLTRGCLAVVLGLLCLLDGQTGVGSMLARAAAPTTSVSPVAAPAPPAVVPDTAREGFTLTAELDLDFTESVYWVGEATATATVALSGGALETGGAGDVAIVCVDGPYSAPGWSGTINDNPITVPVPDIPGEYTYQAFFSVHTDPADPDQHDPHATRESNAVTITVVDVWLSPDPVVVTNGQAAALTATVYPTEAASLVSVALDTIYDETVNPNPGAATLAGTVPDLTVSRGSGPGRTRALATIRGGAVLCATAAVLVTDLTLTVSHAYLLAGGVDTATVTVAVGDGQGNPGPNTTVDLLATAGTLNPIQVTTTGGSATATFTASTDPAVVTITASVPGTSDTTSVEVICFTLTGLTVNGAVPVADTTPPRYAARFGHPGEVVTLRAELAPAGIDPTAVPLTWTGSTADATDKTVSTVARDAAGGTAVQVTATGHTQTATQDAQVVVVQVTGLAPVSADLYATILDGKTHLLTAWTDTPDATTTCTATLTPAMTGDNDVSAVLNQLLVWYGSGTVDPNDATHCAFPRTEPGKTPVQVLCGASDARATLWVIKVTVSMPSAVVPINTDWDWNGNTNTAGDTDLDKMGITAGKEDDLRPLGIWLEPRDVPAGAFALTSRTLPTGASRVAFYTTAGKDAAFPSSWSLTAPNPPTECWVEGRALSDEADDQEITVTYTWGDLDVEGVTTATVQARPGNSSAQVEVFTYTTDPDTGISTYAAERLAPVGGTVGLALRVHVGAGDRLARDAQDALVATSGTLRVEDTWTYPENVSAQIEREVPLTSSTGWQELLSPGTENEAWAPSDPPTACDGTQAATRTFFYWVPEAWDTRKYPSVRYPGMTGDFDPPMGHNGKHAVTLAQINDVETTNGLTFQHHDAQQGGWQPAYESGPAPKEPDVQNLVITGISASTGTVDYLKYDPDPASPYHRPTVSFTFEDKGEDQQAAYTYHCWALIQPTRASGQEFLDLGDIYGYAYAYVQDTATPVTKTFDPWAGKVCIWNEEHTAYALSGADEADWGTYTYDVIINKVDSNENVVDVFAYKWPYCLTISNDEHHVWVTETEQDESPFLIKSELKCNYILRDYADIYNYVNKSVPSEIKLYVVDSELTAYPIKDTVVNANTLNTLHDGIGHDGILADSVMNVHGFFECYRVLFTGVDNCWADYRRDHINSNMLAVNQATNTNTRKCDSEEMEVIYFLHRVILWGNGGYWELKANCGLRWKNIVPWWCSYTLDVISTGISALEYSSANKVEYWIDLDNSNSAETTFPKGKSRITFGASNENDILEKFGKSKPTYLDTLLKTVIHENLHVKDGTLKLAGQSGSFWYPYWDDPSDPRSDIWRSTTVIKQYILSNIATLPDVVMRADLMNLLSDRNWSLAKIRKFYIDHPGFRTIEMGLARRIKELNAYP